MPPALASKARLAVVRVLAAALKPLAGRRQPVEPRAMAAARRAMAATPPADETRTVAPPRYQQSVAKSVREGVLVRATALRARARAVAPAGQAPRCREAERLQWVERVRPAAEPIRARAPRVASQRLVGALWRDAMPLAELQEAVPRQQHQLRLPEHRAHRRSIAQPFQPCQRAAPIIAGRIPRAMRVARPGHSGATA